MPKSTQEILESLLLPKGSDWEIESVHTEESTESIFVNVRFVSPDIVVAGRHFPIFDFRHERTWRHLDLWQYKTYITARIPRYTVDGQVLSVEVPWAEPGERLTELLEKKR